MTDEAERRLTFVDWAWQPSTPEGAEHNRRETLAVLRAAAPDVVVIGEAPLAGVLLELALCASELRIPVVVLDNAYNGYFVEEFCRRHGPICDGVVLSGPSSFRMSRPPDFLTQVPPYIDAAPAEARDLCDSLGLAGRHIMTVLAYDANVEMLAVSIAARLERDDVGVVFLTNQPDRCLLRVLSLPDPIRQQARVLAPLADRLHFGLLAESRLVIGKCAFMQVSECLTLRTPIIGYYYRGDFHLGFIPEECRPFAHMTSDIAADDETVARARHFLDLPPGDMRAVHDGELGSAAATAEWIERVPRQPRPGIAAECERSGLSPSLLDEALRAADGGDAVLQDVRMTLVREPQQQQIFAVVCHYAVGGQSLARRFWLRTFESDAAAQAELARLRHPDARRTLYGLAPDGRALIEQDIGEAALPPLILAGAR
jgi:hypothetical protein